MALRIITPSMKSLSKLTLSIMTINIFTLSITTQNIMKHNTDIKQNYTQFNKTLSIT
jgi:hypothetical protein